MIYVLLVIAAWGSIFLPLPRWLSLLASCLFVGIGSILLLFGLAGSYWASHMTPGTSEATSTLVTAVLLLLSRMVFLVKALIGGLTEPPGPSW